MFRRRARVGRLRFDRGIDRLHPLDDRLRVRRAPIANALRVGDLQLFERLVLAIGLHQLIGQHQSHVVLLGDQVRELLERAEGLVEIIRLLHPGRVLKEVLPRVGLEALLGRDLPELVVDDGAPRRLAKDLVAEGDGGVVEPALGIVIDRAFPDGDRLGEVPRLLEQIPDSVVERDVDRILFARLVDLDHFAIGREGLVHLLLGLEVGRLLLEL